MPKELKKNSKKRFQPYTTAHPFSNPPPNSIAITKIDVNHFFTSIKDEDNKVTFDNVIIINLTELIQKLSPNPDFGDYKKIIEKSYNIFLYYFIVYFVYSRNLYKLDKITRDDDNTTIYNISQLQLDPNTEKLIKTNLRDKSKVANYINEQGVNFIAPVTPETATPDNPVFGHFYCALPIDNIINNNYAIYKTIKNEFIIFNTTHITPNDLETICRTNGLELHVNQKFDLPNFIRTNDDKKLIRTLSKKYIYPQYSFNKTELLYQHHSYGEFEIFDKIEELYTKYLQQTGGNNKYKICINKKTNYAYINYNKNKCYFCSRKNKIFIKLDNNNINIKKKHLSHDSKNNTYFISI